MTPARFDLLYVIRHGVIELRGVGERFMSMLQKDIRVALGLHPSTVSKMVGRLRQIGWIEPASVDDDDERARVVQLTEEGARQIDEATRHVFEAHAHDQHFETALAREAPRPPVSESGPENAVRGVIAGVFSVTGYLARTLGDISLLDYAGRYLEPAEIERLPWSAADAIAVAKARAVDPTLERRTRSRRWRRPAGGEQIGGACLGGA
jgi:DNA-binding MarR family transcriptional regulator